MGLLGFSQGAKIYASLLFQQQVVTEKMGIDQAKTNYRFAILLAGRGPVVSLEPNLVMNSALIAASQIGMSVF
jgi:predicted esterase